MARRPRVVLDGILEGYCYGMMAQQVVIGQLMDVGVINLKNLDAQSISKGSNKNVRNPAEFDILVELLEKQKCKIENEMQSLNVLNTLVPRATEIINSSDSNNKNEMINYALYPMLKVLDLGCGKGRWLAMASTHLREEIEANLSTLHCVLLKKTPPLDEDEDEQSIGNEWKIQDFTWGEKITNKTNINTNKQEIRVQVNLHWFPSIKERNYENKTFFGTE